MSRTPVIAALRMLEGDGLIAITPEIGFAVRRQSDDEVQDLLEYRQALVTYAVGKAAERRRPEEVDRLESLLETFARQIELLLGNQLDVLGRRRLEAVYSEFHLAILKMARNTLLQKRYEYALIAHHVSILTHLVEKSFAARHSGFSSSIVTDHREICEGIRDGDATKAQRAVLNHLKRLTAATSFHDEELESSISYSMEVLV